MKSNCSDISPPKRTSLFVWASSAGKEMATPGWKWPLPYGFVGTGIGRSRICRCRSLLGVKRDWPSNTKTHVKGAERGCISLGLSFVQTVDRLVTGAEVWGSDD